MTKISTATAKVILYKSKTLKDGKHPVMLRITLKGKRKYYTTTYNMDVSEWDTLSNAKRLNKNQKIQSDRFLAVYLKAQKVIQNIEEKGNGFTFKNFENGFFEKTFYQNVFDFIDKIVKELKEENRIGTAITYKDTKSALSRFYKKEDLNFEEVDEAFLKDFIKHYRDSLSINTIGIYLRTFRAVYNKAIKQDLVSADLYPFRNIKIRSQAVPKKALKKEEILKIINHPTEFDTNMRLSQQLFAFSYFCQGMNFKDIAKLQWKNIEDERISYIRSKTGNTRNKTKPISIKITLRIKSILNHFPKINLETNNYIFPIFELGMSVPEMEERKKNMNKLVNKYLNKISSEAKVDKKIIFYMARHTYATVLKRSGLSTELIQEALSHESKNTTEAYLDSFESEVIDKANEFLL